MNRIYPVNEPCSNSDIVIADTTGEDKTTDVKQKLRGRNAIYASAAFISTIKLEFTENAINLQLTQVPQTACVCVYVRVYRLDVPDSCSAHP